ncbi:hypothetical protein DVH05_002821 [Phytophthora capsici]|nr:hypothetical protein DVH05_002821 [Phytophthora capsici]
MASTNLRLLRHARWDISSGKNTQPRSVGPLPFAQFAGVVDKPTFVTTFGSSTKTEVRPFQIAFVFIARKDLVVAQEQHQCGVHRDSHNVAPQQSQSDERNPQKPGYLARDPATFKLQQEEKIKAKGCGLASLLELLNYKQVTLDKQACAQDKERHRLDSRAALNERMERRNLDGLARYQDKKQDGTRFLATVGGKKACDGHDSTIAEWKARCQVEKEVTRASQTALENSLRDAAELRIIIAQLKMRLLSESSVVMD